VCILGRPAADAGMLNARRYAPLDGRQCATRFRVAGARASGRFGEVAEVVLEPDTGRHHQLRRHLAGAPLSAEKTRTNPVSLGCAGDGWA
jgi:23S rRNA-/tRNA-specific pseudouridylate synthase